MEDPLQREFRRGGKRQRQQAELQQACTPPTYAKGCVNQKLYFGNQSVLKTAQWFYIYIACGQLIE